jgi:hypothetical protein
MKTAKQPGSRGETHRIKCVSINIFFDITDGPTKIKPTDETAYCDAYRLPSLQPRYGPPYYAYADALP